MQPLKNLGLAIKTGYQNIKSQLSKTFTRNYKDKTKYPDKFERKIGYLSVKQMKEYKVVKIDHEMMAKVDLDPQTKSKPSKLFSQKVHPNELSIDQKLTRSEQAKAINNASC